MTNEVNHKKNLRKGELAKEGESSIKRMKQDNG